jgi:RNA recognition motif-containing protein
MGNRLYVGNLSFQLQPGLCPQRRSPTFGEITDVHVVSDRETGQSRGFGFVTMGTNPRRLRTPSATMNGALLDGRALKVNEAEERQNRGGGGGGGGGGGRSGGGNRW